MGAMLAAQQNDIPLQRDFSDGLEQGASRKGSPALTGLKPVIEARADVSAVQGYKPDSTKYYFWYDQKIFKDHLLEHRDGDLRLSIDPLFHFEMGVDPGDVTPYADTNRLYHNTRGFLVMGDLGKKLSFMTMFHESQLVVPQYLYWGVRRNGTLPGFGRTKTGAPTTFDVGWSQASLSYSPVAWLNLQMGHGRHFVGHGYRSVLLGGNAPAAPYLKFSIKPVARRLQYTSWLAKLQHGVAQADRLPTGQSSESLFAWMRGRFNHLSMGFGRVEVGLFEATIFRNIDSLGVRPFEPLELNPVLGVNTMVSGFDGGRKSLVGVDLKVGVIDDLFVYGQFATDGPDAGRQAWQAGLRWFNAGVRGLHVQLEHNVAAPFTYMADPVQLAYMHSGQPLAHPMGSNFTESVASVEHTLLERLRLRAKVSLATYAIDSLDRRMDGDLDRVLLDGQQGDLVDRDLFLLDVSASYLFNPKTNLRAMAGVMRRDQPGTADGMQSTYVYIGLGTGLFDRYFDH